MQARKHKLQPLTLESESVLANAAGTEGLNNRRTVNTRDGMNKPAIEMPARVAGATNQSNKPKHSGTINLQDNTTKRHNQRGQAWG